MREYIGNDTFMMTYGDGVSNVDLKQLLKFHQRHGKYATITAVQPKGRFGALDINKLDFVERFSEKSKEDGGWINAGFMVLEPEVMDYIAGDETYFEREPLEKLARDGQLVGYKHEGFWKCMDTLRDKEALEHMWETGRAEWKIWD